MCGLAAVRQTEQQRRLHPLLLILATVKGLDCDNRSSILAQFQYSIFYPSNVPPSSLHHVKSIALAPNTADNDSGADGGRKFMRPTVTTWEVSNTLKEQESCDNTSHESLRRGETTMRRRLEQYSEDVIIPSRHRRYDAFQQVDAPYGHARKPTWLAMTIFVLILSFLSSPAEAVFLPNSSWSNCLSSNIVNPSNGSPKQLQWVPEGIWATFNSSPPIYNLNVTVYGNVTGQQTSASLPPMGSPSWTNPNFTYGKIPDQNNATGFQSTLFGEFSILSYTPYINPGSRFCDSVIPRQNGKCPIGPFWPSSK